MTEEQRKARIESLLQARKAATVSLRVNRIDNELRSLGYESEADKTERKAERAKVPDEQAHAVTPPRVKRAYRKRSV